MKENQKLGIVSIALGVLLFVPLLLNMIVVRATSAGGNAFDILGEMGDVGETWYTMTGIFSIITMIAVAALLAYGIILITGKMEDLSKYYKIVTIVGGAIGLITALCAIMFAVTFDIPVLGDAGSVVPGVGTYLLAVFGILGIAQAFFAPKMLADK